MTTYKNYPFLGFDDIFDILEKGIPAQKTYPPYNVIQADNETTLLEVAVAGFAREDLTVSVVKDTLVVAGKREDEDNNAYLHKGISTRSFERKWAIDPRRLEVRDVKLENGLLRITLVAIVPEEDKPKQIEIL